MQFYLIFFTMANLDKFRNNFVLYVNMDHVTHCSEF